MQTNSRILPFPSRPVVSASSKAGDEALLGPSSTIARVWSQIRRVAPYFRAALLTGESGCGAEAAARALHALSPVSKLPFFVLDNTAFDSGLLFVPNVNQLSPDAQRNLLRHLRARTRPVRIVASTSVALRAAVSAGRFSPALAEALSAVQIALPALRERCEDIPLLLEHAVHNIAARLHRNAPTLDDSFHHAASAFEWPGNLAQLESVLDHVLVSAPHETLSALDFQIAAAASAPVVTTETKAPVRMVRLDDIVQEHIRAVLVASHGNKLRAAEVLGISRSTLYRMLDAKAEFSMAS